MPNGTEIEKSTFVNADEKTHRGLTYDMLKGIWDTQCEQISRCNARFQDIDDDIKVLKKRKIVDKSVAAGSGFVGGYLAMITVWIKSLIFGGS